MMKRVQGFTLIELMIVVAVVGILTAIAYPAYTDAVMKGRRAQARTALMELLQQQERYLTQNNCYLAFTTGTNFTASAQASCGSTPNSVPFKVYAGDNVANAPYRLEAAACSATASLNECVLLTATPTQTDAKVGNLSISSNGVKSCTGTAKSSNFSLCWP